MFKGNVISENNIGDKVFIFKIIFSNLYNDIFYFCISHGSMV